MRIYSFQAHLFKWKQKIHSNKTFKILIILARQMVKHHRIQTNQAVAEGACS